MRACVRRSQQTGCESVLVQCAWGPGVLRRLLSLAVSPVVGATMPAVLVAATENNRLLVVWW